MPGMSRYEVWTDGACSGNPGPGGYAAVVRDEAGDEQELVAGAAQTTNNRMELLAAIAALEELPEGSEIRLVSDSQYVVKGITEWMPGWKKRARKKVKNRDLWVRLDRARERHRVRWEWVRGHDGDPMNERADKLAVAESKRQAQGEGTPCGE